MRRNPACNRMLWADGAARRIGIVVRALRTRSTLSISARDVTIFTLRTRSSGGRRSRAKRVACGTVGKSKTWLAGPVFVDEEPVVALDTGSSCACSAHGSRRHPLEAIRKPGTLLTILGRCVDVKALSTLLACAIRRSAARTRSAVSDTVWKGGTRNTLAAGGAIESVLADLARLMICRSRDTVGLKVCAAGKLFTGLTRRREKGRKRDTLNLSAKAKVALAVAGGNVRARRVAWARDGFAVGKAVALDRVTRMFLAGGVGPREIVPSPSPHVAELALAGALIGCDDAIWTGNLFAFALPSRDHVFVPRQVTIVTLAAETVATGALGVPRAGFQ